MKQAVSVSVWLGLWVLLMAGCGGDDGNGATTLSEPASTTSTTQGAAAPTVDAVELPAPGEPWDVLFLADRSEPISDTVAELYLQSAQAALGVEARNHGSVDYLPNVKDVLADIRDQRYPGLSATVREAEIIVVQTWPRGTIRDEEFEACEGQITDPPPLDPAEFQATEYWAQYREVLGEIYTEIWRLREGAATVLIGIDWYDPFVSQQVEVGITQECRVFVETYNEVQREVAEAHGARWVSLYDVLNGPKHDLDPLALGYVGPSDQTPAIALYTPNEIGAEMIADALAAAGYQPVVQP